MFYLCLYVYDCPCISQELFIKLTSRLARECNVEYEVDHEEFLKTLQAAAPNSQPIPYGQCMNS